MARYEHLPIYKTAMDLMVYIEQVVRNFSRYYKYTLGSDLRQQSRELVTLIIRANSRREKLPVLYDLRERLEGLQVLLRIGQEVRTFQRLPYGRDATSTSAATHEAMRMRVCTGRVLEGRRSRLPRKFRISKPMTDPSAAIE